MVEFSTGQNEKGSIQYVICDWQQINKGTVQGSVSGPYLFSIYLNDLEFSIGEETICLSAYDIKNIFRLFERPFKIQKNGVFLFEISLFMLEILTFFYYAN